MIYESMSAPSRTFHGVQHVFDISVNADPVQTVSAFFHDVVYYSIDGGLSPGQARRLEGIIDEEGGGGGGGGGGAAKKVSVKRCGSSEDSSSSDGGGGDDEQPTTSTFDPGIALTLDLFGFVPSQTLNPFKGLNEFLSACLAVRCLGGTLELRELAKIVVCIEATIPFRPKDAKGLTAMQHLYQRLRDANVKHSLNLTEDDVVRAVRRAADLANRDVDNFASADRAHFLSNTWNLLPESNISLRHGRVFRIGDFADALRKMTGFFSGLNPDVIYCNFRNVPTDEAVAELTSKARSNIEAALKYMQCKLLSISVLAALAAKTGGDAPIALFLGDLPEPNRRSPSVEDRIRPLSSSEERPQDGSNVDAKVYALLRDGRDAASSFDIKNSPLAAYLYGLMGDEGLYDALRHAVHPMDEGGADAMLDSIPRNAVKEIAEACAEIAITRRRALTDIAEKYAKETTAESAGAGAAQATTATEEEGGGGGTGGNEGEGCSG